jgi:hypothetical protein
MDKISGILSASPRTSKMDISNSQPARPGAPMTGRPEGKNSLGDRISLSKEVERIKEAGLTEEGPDNASEVSTSATPTYKNTSENAKVKIIQDLNRKFFTGTRNIGRPSEESTKSEQVLKNIEDEGPMTDMAQSVQPESHDLPESKVEMPL